MAIDFFTDKQAKALAESIKRVETGGKQVRGKTGELPSMYQFTPPTWKTLSKKYLGVENAPLNKANEDLVAYAYIKELKDQGYTPKKIASIWNSGKPEYEGNVGINKKYGVKYDVPAYVNKVYAAYQEVKPQETPKQPQSEGIGGFFKNVSELFGFDGLTKGASNAIFLNLTKEGKQTLKDLSEGKITPDQFDEILGGKLPEDREVLASGARVLMTALAPSLGSKISAPTAMGRIGQAALTGAGFGATEGAIQTYEKGTPETLGRDVVGGATVGAALGGVAQGVLGELPRAALKNTPAILSKVSGLEEGALQRQFDRPVETGAIAATDISAPKVLNTAQQAARELRKDLTSEFQTGQQRVIDKYAGKRIGLNQREQKLLSALDDDFGFASIPQNLDEISAKEAMTLYSEVGDALDSVIGTPQGVKLQNFKNALKTKLASAFGDDFTSLMKNYSEKKGILDEINRIARTYKEGTPSAQRAALNDLTKIYRENSVAYMDALKKLEKVSGKSFLDELARLETSDFLPKTSGPLNLSDLFRMMLFPLFSPKTIGAEVRFAGKMSQGINKIPKVRALGRVAGQTILRNQSE